MKSDPIGLEIASQALALANGEHVRGVSVLSGHRRVCPYWLRLVASRIIALEDALKTLVKDWDSVDPMAPVPDEINVNEHWSEARWLLGIPEPDGH